MRQSSFEHEGKAGVVQGIENHLALAPVFDQPGAPQVAQVVGCCCHGGSGNAGHVANAQLVADQGIDYLQPGFVPQGFKEGSQTLNILNFPAQPAHLFLVVTEDITDINPVFSQALPTSEKSLKHLLEYYNISPSIILLLLYFS